MAITPDEARKEALKRLPMSDIEEAIDNLIVYGYQDGQVIVTREDILANIPKDVADRFEDWWWNKIAQQYRFANWSVEEKPDGFHFKENLSSSYYHDDR